MSRLFAVAVAVPLVMFLGTAVVADPVISLTTQQSSNWSGYAVATNLTSPTQNSIDYVSGNWIVPTVNATSKSLYSASWVGIDGFKSSTTVEQTGTTADSGGGGTSYTAWYEMYPASPVTISMTIHPGDLMSGMVRWTGSLFELTLSDITTENTFTTYQLAPSGYKRNSAEWIFEAPTSGSVLPLAQFTSEPFTDAQVSVAGTVGAIDNSLWQNANIYMIDPAGGTAYPGGLTDPTLTTSNFTIYPTSVPEPATLLLISSARESSPAGDARGGIEFQPGSKSNCFSNSRAPG